jgi:hypothetical protein
MTSIWQTGVLRSLIETAADFTKTGQDPTALCSTACA